MTYSCTDFTDTILDALGIDVPEEDTDNPEAQADLALAEIARLQGAARSTSARTKLHVDALFDAVNGYREATRKAGANVRLIREARLTFAAFATEHGLPIDFTDPEDRI